MVKIPFSVIIKVPLETTGVTIHPAVGCDSLLAAVFIETFLSNRLHSGFPAFLVIAPVPQRKLRQLPNFVSKVHVIRLNLNILTFALCKFGAIELSLMTKIHMYKQELILTS